MKHGCILFAALAALSPSLTAQKIAITAERLFTLDGGPQGGPGTVLITDGKIESLRSGAADSTSPPGYLALHAKVVTPGLIDTATTTGISGAYNIPADQDQDERSDPNAAEVRVIDSFNPNELLLKWINQHGTTTIQVTPGPRNVIAGAAAIFKTVGPKSHATTVDRLAVRTPSAMVFNLGDTPKATYGEHERAPSTRMKEAAMIRTALASAKTYQAGWDRWRAEGSAPDKQPAHDGKLDALAPVVAGKLPAIFNVHRADDIETAIRLGREFALKYMLSSLTEGYLALNTLAAAKVPLLFGPEMQGPESLQTANASLESPWLLQSAGNPVALMTGYEAYVPKSRVLLFEAGVAAGNGAGLENTLRMITSQAAQILGISDRVGSLAPGKDADVVLFDGDPFEYTTHVLAVLVSGNITYQRNN